jgi:hypothetical protein
MNASTKSQRRNGEGQPVDGVLARRQAAGGAPASRLRCRERGAKVLPQFTVGDLSLSYSDKSTCS